MKQAPRKLFGPVATVSKTASDYYVLNFSATRMEETGDKNLSCFLSARVLFPISYHLSIFFYILATISIITSPIFIAKQTSFNIIKFFRNIIMNHVIDYRHYLVINQKSKRIHNIYCYALKRGVFGKRSFFILKRKVIIFRLVKKFSFIISLD